MLAQKTEKVELKAMGDLTIVSIPADVLKRSGMRGGDTVFLVETPDGILLSSHDVEVRRQVAIGTEFMDQYDETFKRLAQ